MTAIENKLLEKQESIMRRVSEQDVDLLSLVRERFRPYFGMTEEELCRKFRVGTPGKRPPKNACALVTRRILGVSEDAKIEEFEKAGIVPKTMRLRHNGRPKEAMSFPAFDYFDLEKTPFEDSDFYGYLQQRYLFVIFREGNDGIYRLSDICFWQMPDRDLDEAKRCYDQMRQNVHEGHAEISVRSTENRCCHVRPHGQTAEDVLPQPHGTPVTKKSFWLNQGYLQEQIERSLEQ